LGRGRHTTSWAAIYDIGWARVLDTPGLREIGFAEAGAAGDDALGVLFPDIGELAKGCRFRDCSHAHEPGCAVKVALEAGELDEARYRRFVELQRALNR
ncbi:MAG: ribosome small subunit-dependent GTPase, partial [Bacillota bacterium]